MKKSPFLVFTIFAGSLPLLSAAPFEWIGPGVDFFDESKWTDNGGAVTGDPFVAAAGMLGGPGAYNIRNATLSTGAGTGVTGAVHWDVSSTVNFTNTNGRFLTVMRSSASTVLNFDASDLYINTIAEWNNLAAFSSQAGPFGTQWKMNLTNDSDVVSSSNGTAPNAGIWYGNVTISDTSSLAVDTAYYSFINVASAGASVTFNANSGTTPAGNPLNLSVVNLTAVGASVRFNNETVDRVLANHLYATSTASPSDGMLIGGAPIGVAGMTAANLGAGGSYTDPVNGAAFTLVSDGATGSIFMVTSLPTTPARNLTYTNASGTSVWAVNGAADWNQNTTAVPFFNGDSIAFNDAAFTANPSVITLAVAPPPAVVMPGALDVNVTDGHTYAISGEIYGGAPITKTGTGTLRFTTPDLNMPYYGQMTLDGGSLEIGGWSNALRNARLLVNPGSTFRVLSNTTTQDLYNPDTIMAGGTWDNEDRSFSFRPITLAAGTTSTFNTDAEFLTWGGAFRGTGNLVKTGASFFEINGADATYTGTTTIQQGNYNVNATRKSASTDWTVQTSGTLLLRSDSSAPIQNIPATSIVRLNGGTLDVRGNTETLGTLTSAGGTLMVGGTGGALTVGTLDLTGGQLNVVLEGLGATGSAMVMNVGTINGPLSNLKTSIRNGVFTYNAGILTVASSSGTVTWNGSSSGEWDTTSLNWLNGSTADRFYAGDAVRFTDVASNKAVNLAAPMNPGSVTFDTTNDSLNDYFIAGSGIAGSGGLAKNGEGWVTLQNANTYTGPTIINAGRMILTPTAGQAIASSSAITVKAGAVLDISATNAIQRGATAAPIVIDGGTLSQSIGVHAHIGNITLRNGASWDSITSGSYFGVNIDLDGNVTVEGTSASTIGPFGSGLGFSAISPTFTVQDVTSGDAVDLTVSASLRGTLGFTKAGPGRMFLSGNNNDYAGNTVVSQGTVVVEDLLAVPNDLTKISVAAGAGFGGIAGPANLTDAELESLALSVGWDAGGDARFIIDTQGQTVTVASNFAGNFKILAIGGGVLNLTGTLAVNQVIGEGSTTVNTVGGPQTTVKVDLFTIGAGTTAGTKKATIAFTATGPVDVYASDNLTTWGAPVAAGVTVSPYVQDNLTAAKRFYVLVPAGQTFPP